MKVLITEDEYYPFFEMREAVKESRGHRAIEVPESLYIEHKRIMKELDEHFKHLDELLKNSLSKLK